MEEKKLRTLLEGEQIIKDFTKKTNKSLDFLLNDVSITPNDDDPMTWAVTWVGSLDPLNIPDLSEAALLVWFYQGRGTEEQRERANDRITIASMRSAFLRGMRFTGKKPGKHSSTISVTDELLKIMVKLGPDLTLDNVIREIEGKSESVVRNGFEDENPYIFEDVDKDKQEVYCRNRKKPLKFKTIMNRMTALRKIMKNKK